VKQKSDFETLNHRTAGGKKKSCIEKTAFIYTVNVFC